MSEPRDRFTGAVGSRRRGGRRALALGVLLAASLVLLLVVERSGDRQPLGGGEVALPEDLPAHAVRLRRLELPAGVADLGWLPTHLVELSLDSLSDRQLAQLPPRLRRLEVRRGAPLGAELTDLSGLPASLESLTFLAGTVDRLGELPSSLRVLRLGRVVELDPDRLPEDMTRLGLDSVRMAALWRGLSGLETLELSGALVTGVEGIDRLSHLTDLSLRGTRVDELDGLPRMLRSLDLQGNRLSSGLSFADLPPFLVELRLRDQALSPSAEDATGPARLPESLRTLHVSGRDVQASLLAALGPGLAELRLEGEGRLDLCSAGAGPDRPSFDALEVLYLSAGVEVDLACLPASLEVLYLEGATADALARVSVPLRGLGIVDSFGFDPDVLRASTRELRTLDLSFSRPLAQPDLAALGSLSHLRYLDAPLESLPELPASLRVLDLQDSRRLRSIQGLDRWCPELRVLRIGGTEVSSLAHLPQSIVELDLRGLDLPDLEDLPPGLEKLTISAGSVARLGRLPLSLEDLSIVEP